MSGAPVTSNATSYSGVGETCTTDASGQCVLANLQATTTGLTAKSGSNDIAVDGLAASTTQIKLQLITFTVPIGNSAFGSSKYGMDGRTAHTVIEN